VADQSAIPSLAALACNEKKKLHFGKGQGQHIIRCLKNKKCENEERTATSIPPIPLYLFAISGLPPPHTLKSIILCTYVGHRLSVRFFMKGAHSMGLFHIHTNHSINTCKHPTPTRLGKVRVGVGCPSSPHQRAFVCGACTGTAQVGVSCVSLFGPLFKRSGMHCLHVCLT